MRAVVAGHYRGNLRRYARFKLRNDPVYAAVSARLIDPSAAILDIGSGIGLLGCWLRAHGHNGRYLGVDCDATKVAQAQGIAAEQGLDLAFQTGDANALPPFCGTVVLLDVLHYLGREHQQAVLIAAAERVADGGLLIVRTVLREPAWRYFATVFEEHLLYGCGWMQMPARHFPARAELERTLHAQSLVTEISPLWGRTPFASFLIVARRRPASSHRNAGS